MARPVEFSDEQIVQAGAELEERYRAEFEVQQAAGGKARMRRITGTALIGHMGGGNAARAARVWAAHVAERDGGAEPVGEVKLSEPLHSQVTAAMDSLYRTLATVERSMVRAAHEGADGYVAELLADNKTLGEDNALLADANKRLEERVADLERTVAVKGVEIGRLNGRVQEVLAERDAAVFDAQRQADEQRQRADDAEAQANASAETALASRVAAVSAEGARKTAQAALRRLGDDAATIREHLSGVRADGVAPELDALQRLTIMAWAAADVSPAVDIPDAPGDAEAAVPEEPPPAARRTRNRRRTEPQPET